MKILQVIDILEVGGAEKLLITLSNIQNRYKNKVTIVTLLKPGTLVDRLDRDINRISLNRIWKYNPITMFRFVQIVKNYDLIHVHCSHNLRYVFLSIRLFGLKKPIVFHEHFGNIDIDNSVKWHQKYIYPKVNFIGVSKKLCEWAFEKCNVPKKNIHFLPNIVEHKPFLGFDENVNLKINFIATCNIRRPKNIEFLISLFYQFNQLNQNNLHKLTIIGQPYDDIYFDELKRMLSNYNLNDAIKFEHDCTEIQPILRKYNFALHSAFSESGPLVLIEYLAQGIPFLTYKTGDIPDFVINDFPEFVIDNFEIKNWIISIIKILEMDRVELGIKMRKFYESKFSEESYYLQCIEIYKKALGC